MFYFLADAASGAEGATPGGFSPIIMIVLMVAIFYFMLIRPENKRKKEAEQMRSAVKTGDRITTIGADQVRIEFAKWALSTNDSATERAKEAAQKAQEEKAKAKAAKKAAKENKNNR